MALVGGGAWGARRFARDVARGRPQASSRRLRFARALLPVVALSATLVAGTQAASADTPVQALATTNYLWGVACPTAGLCLGVGGAHAGSPAVLVPITAGVAGTPVAVPGTESFYGGVSCPTSDVCVAVGLSASGAGVVVTITNGIPGPAEVVPGFASLVLRGVACTSASTCVAVGNTPYVGAPSRGVVVPISQGIPGAPQVVTGTTVLMGVACPTVTTCEAVGSGSAGVIVSITGGIAGAAQAVAGSNGLRAVACPTAATCVAVGQNGLVLPIANGVPGSGQTVAGINYLAGISCRTATSCEAAGVAPSYDHGMLVPIADGVPGSAQPIAGTSNFYGVACPSAGMCEAVGNLTGGTLATEGVVAAVASQTVVSLTFDNAAISQYTLGYQHGLAPAGVRATFYINSGVLGGANHLSWAQLAALSSAGEEIGGKTVHGTNLTTLTASQQVDEICNDRQAILSHGLTPVGFAYPAGAFNATLQSEVHSCGYNNARTAGGLSPAGPSYAEPIPPRNWLALRAYAPVGRVTLANLEALVTGAAAHGEGWAPVVLQKVCSQALEPANYATCTTASGWIELDDLNAFISWVQHAGRPDGAPAGTVFEGIGSTAASVGLPGS